MEKLTQGYALAEAPVWIRNQGLMFSDVLRGGVFCIDRLGALTQIFAYRRGIGGMCYHENGGMIVSGRNISWKSIPEGETRIIIDRDETAGLVGFNDMTTDARGRIYAGSLGASPDLEEGRDQVTGHLYMIDLDGSSQQVASDIELSNGLGFSPDGKTLYHADSTRRQINCYTVCEDGALGNKQVFVTTDGEGGPDGLAVTTDGRVWVAQAGDHGIGVYNPDGSKQRFIEIPEPMCASVCFGGNDLQDLYIVSGSRDAGSDTAGSVYVMRADVPGVPVAPARVQLPDTHRD